MGGKGYARITTFGSDNTEDSSYVQKIDNYMSKINRKYKVPTNPQSVFEDTKTYETNKNSSIKKHNLNSTAKPRRTYEGVYKSNIPAPKVDNKADDEDSEYSKHTPTMKYYRHTNRSNMIGK